MTHGPAGRTGPGLAVPALDTCCEDCTPAAAAHRDERWLRNARYVRWLAWASLAWMAAEGAIAIIAAVIAGSVALLGFGLDSAIEGLASVIIIWRFTGTRTLSETAEARARKAVAVTFFLLAPYIAYDAAATLIARDHAWTSWLGIGLSIASLIVMPVLGTAKRRLGARLDSAATRWGGYPEPAVRLPGRRRAGRAAGQHPARLVVAGPGRGPGHRRPGCAGRYRGLARRGMRLLS